MMQAVIKFSSVVTMFAQMIGFFFSRGIGERVILENVRNKIIYECMYE